MKIDPLYDMILADYFRPSDGECWESRLKDFPDKWGRYFAKFLGSEPLHNGLTPPLEVLSAHRVAYEWVDGKDDGQRHMWASCFYSKGELTCDDGAYFPDWMTVDL